MGGPLAVTCYRVPLFNGVDVSRTITRWAREPTIDRARFFGPTTMFQWATYQWDHQVSVRHDKFGRSRAELFDVYDSAPCLRRYMWRNICLSLFLQFNVNHYSTPLNILMLIYNSIFYYLPWISRFCILLPIAASYYVWLDVLTEDIFRIILSRECRINVSLVCNCHKTFWKNFL